MNTSPETYAGVLNLLTFGFSIFAAVLAIDMYALLRTGQFGRTWRILIVASVIFVMLQVLQMSGGLLDPGVAQKLSQVTELIFVIALTYAFYRQRQVYSFKLKHERAAEEEAEAAYEATNQQGEFDDDDEE